MFFIELLGNTYFRFHIKKKLGRHLKCQTQHKFDVYFLHEKRIPRMLVFKCSQVWIIKMPYLLSLDCMSILMFTSDSWITLTKHGGDFIINKTFMYNYESLELQYILHFYLVFSSHWPNFLGNPEFTKWPKYFHYFK